MALTRCGRVGADTGNLMPATPECVRHGATTGEWAGVLREVFGEYRAPTGVSGSVGVTDGAEIAAVRAKVDATADELGGRLRFLVGKPGLDGHSGTAPSRSRSGPGTSGSR